MIIPHLSDESAAAGPLRRWTAALLLFASVWATGVEVVHAGFGQSDPAVAHVEAFDSSCQIRHDPLTCRVFSSHRFAAPVTRHEAAWRTHTTVETVTLVPVVFPARLLRGAPLGSRAPPNN